MNEVFGTKFKIVTGVCWWQPDQPRDGAKARSKRATIPGRAGRPPGWLADKKITVIAQTGPPAADLDAPALEALAKDADERAVIEVIASAAHLERPIALNPGVAEERVAAMRGHCSRPCRTPVFLADAAALHFEVAPVERQRMLVLVEKLMRTPRPIAARARRFDGVSAISPLKVSNAVTQ